MKPLDKCQFNFFSLHAIYSIISILANWTKRSLAIPKQLEILGFRPSKAPGISIF